MKRGLNRPFLVIGQSGKERETLVVKSRAGYADRPEAMLKELFALLMARKLGLNAPEPVLVELLPGFDFGASDHDGYPELIQQSHGWNVGTVHLGEDWKPWIQGSKPRSITDAKLEDAYAFDGMIQNSDREPDNPNMLWKGSELAVLDFDKAFAFLRIEEAEDRPWRKTLVRQNLSRHCLHQHLPEPAEGEVIGAALWAEFEGWWLGNPSGRISAEIAAGMADPDLDLPRLEDYLRKLSSATEDFFQYLTDASRQ